MSVVITMVETMAVAVAVNGRGAVKHWVASPPTASTSQHNYNVINSDSTNKRTH